MSLLRFSQMFCFPLLTRTWSHSLTVCLWKFPYTNVLCPSLSLTLPCSLSLAFPSHHPLCQVFLEVPCWSPLFLTYPFFLDKLIQTLGLHTHSHLMISQPSSPAVTPSLNSRAPIQHNQNQSSGFSQRNIICLRLMEQPSC